ncbi:MAG: hypothetical protein N2507_01385 [Candidatus Bipolaricaulota bacterium]|nr:hypothetical protein [Candidatus Bipolaricaulota bacterium]
MTPEEETLWAGRAALRVRARPKGGRPPFPSRFFDADEVVLWMDQERGVVLRYQLWAQGRLFQVIEARAVEFDLPLPEELFAFPPDVKGPVLLLGEPAEGKDR